ncbi:male-enhanced antigen 1-like [Uranotaenia lowii]|uniref:male-enhanced antigen 1-like n=1 Tax=Uranotaenia lowii TaxID=190385 RepID=UPI00247AB2A3|nr:male-enhanced antigen 1-like [Uranotaenia lowii]XP_055597836.1 male-enhanced antigen 1-like [Uranotaenia lowii]XP_055597837.1 male-enhanced antigen 1-like [Uranotaenia lowii]XP_055598249.1 male-enhanced antigen 1-like [Uranotaenia lowii]XP_055598250.1 male-enhanced antigen 1-like [Uranotaenia lowii]XP_055598251.1 male-enhanced antigen 1-like [Uranotaenia lowii]
MGLPELPGSNDSDEHLTVHENDAIHMDAVSDESENEFANEGEYDGYQPLNKDEESDIIGDENMDLDAEMATNDHSRRSDQNTPRDFLNLDVWNAPRPNILSIDLDPVKTEQIVNAMAGFNLPTTSVPEWAIGVPEERWKEELLQRIRLRQPNNADNI